MKVMILAAGRGERLRPLTDHTPKPLVQAGRYRLIEYLIFNLVKAGFDDIVINYAHLGAQFPRILGNGEKYNARIQYSPELDGGLETAGGILNALPLLGEQPFLVVNGDIWTEFDFSTLSDFALPASSLCHLVLVNNPSHHPAGDFALTSDNRILDQGEPRFTFSGIGIYRPELFSDLEPGKHPLKPLFVKAIENGQITGQLFQGQWSDIGTVERLQQLIIDQQSSQR